MYGEWMRLVTGPAAVAIMEPSAGHFAEVIYRGDNCEILSGSPDDNFGIGVAVSRNASLAEAVECAAPAVPMMFGVFGYTDDFKIIDVSDFEYSIASTYEVTEHLRVLLEDGVARTVYPYDAPDCFTLAIGGYHQCVLSLHGALSEKPRTHIALWGALDEAFDYVMESEDASG